MSIQTSPATLPIIVFRFMILCVIAWFSGCRLDDEPIRLHPGNPHYFEWRGTPVILIGSTEHYGAVLNREFDFETYFKTLQKDGLNLTRTFTGVYCEHPEAFNITRNTLAPGPGKLIAPWARSLEPGYANGGNKFDLSRWDEAYFKRLTRFLESAKRHGIVVELVLFCTYYGEEQWRLSPLNPANNINGIGEGVDKREVLTLKDPVLTRVQDEMVRKIVTELNRYDNLYYEICNEPYFGGPTLEWQQHVSRIIRETDLPNRHIIAQNIANHSQKIADPDPNVDLFNFHYALSSAVDENYHLDKALGDDETGFAGTHDRPYRLEAWNFLISGGSLVDHLDYSFAVGYEDGSFQFPSTQPGGGSPELRRQFGFMKRYLEDFDLLKLKPLQDLIQNPSPTGVNLRVLGNPGNEYALYCYRNQATKQNFSLRWTARLTPDATGKYTFHTITDDGVRLWIDHKLLIDDWTSHAPTENSADIQLRAGEPVELKMEYFQGVGGASAELHWSRPGGEKGPIERRFFQLPDGSSPGVKLEWFDDVNLENYRTDTVVSDIAFDGSLEDIFPSARQTDPAAFELDLPSGRYQLDWIDPVSGKTVEQREINHDGGQMRFRTPEFEYDIAARLQATSSKN